MIVVKVFKVRDGYRLRGASEEVIQRIEQLKEQGGGHVTPDALWRDGQDERSPLHGEFEHDKDVASRLYNEERARYLLRSYTVTFVDRGEHVRGPIICNVRTHDEECGSRYTSIEMALGDEETRENVLQEARKLLAGVTARLEALDEFKDMAVEIRRILARLERRRRRQRA